MFRPIAVLVSAFALSACAQDYPVAPASIGAVASVASKASTGNAVLFTAKGAGGSAECIPDSKFIGRIALTTGDTPGEWWGLTKAGFIKAGISPGNYQATIEGFFGMQFLSLDAAVAYLVEQTYVNDANGNRFLCAYEIRGTLAGIGDPNYTKYAFHVRDDNRVKP